MPCHFFGGCRLHGDFKQLAVFASRLSSSCQPIGVSIFNPNEAVVEIHSSPGVQAVNLQKAAGKEDGNLSNCFQFRNLASKETFQISMCFYELQNNCWCFQIYQHSSIYMIGIFLLVLEFANNSGVASPTWRWRRWPVDISSMAPHGISVDHSCCETLIWNEGTTSVKGSQSLGI